MRRRALVATLALCLPLLAGPAWAGTAQPQVVSDRPVAGPGIVDGSVRALAQSGDIVYAGGTFTKVQTPSGQAARRLVAWDTRTRSLVTTFAPQLDGNVTAIEPGPDGTVYVGGRFKKVNGTSARVVQLNGRTGAVVTLFVPPAIDAPVETLGLASGRLYVGGTFHKVAGRPHSGLVALDARTGAVDPQVSTTVAGHHAWTGSDPKQVSGPVGVNNLAVSPDGRTLVAVGNFTTVDGQPRDQVAMLDVSGATAQLRTWYAPRYEALCSKAYDSYVRDVDFSPDGRWFVIASTGGRRGGSLCDSAARFETAGSGLAVEPTWVSTSGADSLLSVAVTGEAVYLGGHERWMNNAYGGDVPGPGAVPRPGVAAVDPENGVPLSWNPGRHPRGVGTWALLATDDGLWVGSDTSLLGHKPAVRAPKIGFFPLAGGRDVTAAKALGPVPGSVYVGAGAALTVRGFDGGTAGAAVPAGSPLGDPSRLRGVFTAGDTVFYGQDDGMLHERRLSGGGFSTDGAVVDPYDDPYWSGVKNGSGPPIAPAGQTYRGVLPGFYGSELASVTAMFYDGRGRLYYTLAGKSALYWRAFSPDVQRTPGAVTAGGVVHPVRNQVPGVSLPGLTGAFLSSGGDLFYAAGGSLWRAPFRDGRPGTATRVGAGVDWSSRALFLAPA